MIDEQIYKSQVQCEPIKPKCEYCNDYGFVPIGSGIRGIKKCPLCDAKPEPQYKLSD